MDNGGTAKEGVGRTYAGVDGYCPLASYIGSHGFCLESELNSGFDSAALQVQAVAVAGLARPVRRVLRLIERTIGGGGQHLIVPE